MKTYIEQKLREKGYDVHEQALQQIGWHFFHIHVSADEAPEILPGHCFGAIYIRIIEVDYSEAMSFTRIFFNSIEPFLLKKM